jgi:hypothetical protein
VRREIPAWTKPFRLPLGRSKRDPHSARFLGPVEFGREGTAVQTIALSESSVAVFRLRVKGHKLPVDEQRLGAYRELAEAGIVEPAEEDFKFTDDGWTHREELLVEAHDRIERGRFEPPDAVNLSEAARDFLRRRVAGDDRVTPENLGAYRELAAAWIMYPVSTWAGGPESVFRFTLAGYGLTRSGWLTGGG